MLGPNVGKGDMQGGEPHILEAFAPRLLLLLEGAFDLLDSSCFKLTGLGDRDSSLRPNKNKRPLEALWLSGGVPKKSPLGAELSLQSSQSQS